MKIISKTFSKYSFLIIQLSGLFAVILFVIGLYFVAVSPNDYQQEEYVKIMYVHVPSAWMALGVYSFMGLCSFVYVVWRNQFFDLLASRSAPIGSVFAFISLVTGSLWGQPVWGTWWVWDARLTSMLILFFFYLGYIILSHSLKNEMNKSDAPAVLSIIGLVNVPIVKFSVDYWSSLHQKASIIRVGGSAIAPEMLLPLLIMFFACIFLFINILAVSIKAEIYRRKCLRTKAILDNS